MINFDDLTPEDKEKLLHQARLIIEEENINKNAVGAYKIKRKELATKNMTEIYNALHMKPHNKEGLRQRYTSVTNYLFKFVINGKYDSKDHVISNATEWDLFEKVNNIVKDAFIACYNLKK